MNFVGLSIWFICAFVNLTDLYSRHDHVIRLFLVLADTPCSLSYLTVCYLRNLRTNFYTIHQTKTTSISSRYDLSHHVSGISLHLYKSLLPFPGCGLINFNVLLFCLTLQPVYHRLVTNRLVTDSLAVCIAETEYWYILTDIWYFYDRFLQYLVNIDCCIWCIEESR